MRDEVAKNLKHTNYEKTKTLFCSNAIIDCGY